LSLGPFDVYAIEATKTRPEKTKVASKIARDEDVPSRLVEAFAQDGRVSSRLELPT